MFLRIAGIYTDEGRQPTIVQQIKRVYEKDFHSHFFPGDTDTGQSAVHLDDAVDAIVRTVERRDVIEPKTAILIGEAEPVSYQELVILFGLDVIALGIISVLLVLTQTFVIGRWCFLCLITAAISLLLVYWAWDEVRVSLAYPRAVGGTGESSKRIATIAFRLSRLMLHALGHLAGLSRAPDTENLMFRPAMAEELDSMQTLTALQVEKLRAAFIEVADQRLEERAGRPLSVIPFIARSAAINAREIMQAIIAARPWEFPKRFSGLTLASASTLVVLLLTAESWDLSLSQNMLSMTMLILASWFGTTAYVVIRQQLIVLNRKRASEQIVVTNLSATGIVFTGMLFTWLALTTAAMAIAYMLFGPELIASWSSSIEESVVDIGWGERMQMALFSASLSLMIGALGSSFESQHYFRHVIFVDEEI